MTAAAPLRGLRRRGFRPDLVLWLLFGVVLVGGALRFGGIGWGLPFALHADEWVVVEGAIDMAQRNSFAPPHFFRPDHLETELSYIVYQAWSHLVGGGSPEVLFAVEPAPFYALARAVTAALGTAAIVIAYFIGAAFTRTAGLWAAFAVAFFPPFVENSRYATPDIPLVFAVLLVILGCVRYVQTESWTSLVLASAGVAIGVTAKYPALAATVTIAAAIVIASVRSRQWWRIPVRGAAAIGMTLAFTFAISPTLFTNFSAVREQLLQQNSTGHLGADGLDWAGNAAFYAAGFVNNAGVLVVAFAVIGLVASVLRRRWDMTPLLTGVIFWVAISALTLHWDRWGLPMYLTPLLFAAVGADAAWRWASSRGRTPRLIVIVAGSLSMLALLLASAAQLATALAADTRQTAAADLAERGIEADDTFFDGYTPFLTDGPRNLASELTVVDGVLEPREGIDRLPYILTSSAMVSRYLNAQNMPEEQSVYTAIRQLPSDTVWTSIGSPPATPWEPARIWRSVDYLMQVIGGADTGPELILYRTPDAEAG